MNNTINDEANMKQAYTVPELASTLSVSETHIWNSIRRKEINTFKVGRRTLISGTELKRLMEGGNNDS